VSRANYTWLALPLPHIIVIYDLCIGRSVTNDADAVIADFVRLGVDVDLFRFLYRDTTGRWDELCVRGGAFAGFNAIGAQTLSDALHACEAEAGSGEAHTPRACGVCPSCGEPAIDGKVTCGQARCGRTSGRR
jgi:hypothetical protein